jgi:hypothetical protein
MSGSEEEEEVAGGMRKFLEEELLRCVLSSLHTVFRLSEMAFIGPCIVIYR